MRGAAVVRLWRHDPNVVRQIRRDLLQHVETGGFDAIVVGDQDAHFSSRFRVFDKFAGCLSQAGGMILASPPM